ncbi:MAG: disulfide bond formation protein B [Gammaproteobacteria bacterium]|nr:disulfide bond formation protein B [Gammaproteobacteria bacterium]
MNVRLANALGALACGGLMAYALYAQHGLGLEPCPLCIFQRVAVIALGAVFIVAALHPAGPAGRRVYALLLALVALAGSGVAARHVWLTTLPPERVPACGPGLDFMLDAFPLADTLAMVLSGSGECAKVEWSFLGLPMPAWVLAALVVLGAFGMIVNWRAVARR